MSKNQKILYLIASICFFLLVILIFIDGFILAKYGGRPESVLNILNQLHNTPFIGLANLDLLYMIDQIILIPTIFAIFLALKHAHKYLTLVFAIFSIIGLLLIIPANTAFQMLALSKQLGSVPNSQLIEQGTLLLARLEGPFYLTHIIIGSIAIAGLSVMMLVDPKKTFSVWIGIMGILGNGLSLGMFIPVIGTWLIVVSIIPLLIWVILLGIRFIRLTKAQEI